MTNEQSNTNKLEFIQQLENGWLRVKVPLPFSLKYVNAYLIPEPEGGCTVIDPGLHTPEAVEAWESVLQSLGITFSDIARIVLTHQHPDHYGLAGLFQQRSGAPVWISRASQRYAERMWGVDRSLADRLVEVFRLHGMPADLRDGIKDNLESFVPMVSPYPAVSYMEAGEPFRFGGIDWTTIEAHGHAEGQILFYDEASRIMICGDQVMPDITPNVSVVPGEREDPLEAFLISLEQLSKLDVSLALPGHRDPIIDFTGRCEALIAHHARRLDKMVAFIQEQPESSVTGFAMCELLFSGRITLNMHNLRFAMAETLAHLVRLEKQGRVALLEQNGQYIYRAK
ncbi:glyoxylase-like metal-dependent hydrolase (beta-lactamase superfamily II) [Paenibacillus cellulosilyticus]|uniref:Glyoxylase-like metal-dependent hydrolase (Beta-lactamase superfamily II) n=1 Tax=Paenibacillus cellulosilyticus TaxID=375489 RepID=A0A2V2YGN6_9BACL|nr:MBL fold metallo-hydrolase [Paenibacillus cellulosilyticus]PWV92057.1 glyoxylase-like metal-dependent hydrolase (beta-lactamase superfamily II) [Paenibacillus cellulosilyticus]QKS46738.1 MBL fold metallo-hydrolase [Paenibacillus cellulosilyticus]